MLPDFTTSRHSSYADDMGVLVTGSAENDQVGIKIRGYDTVTGVKVNRDKYFD